MFFKSKLTNWVIKYSPESIELEIDGTTRKQFTRSTSDAHSYPVMNYFIPGGHVAPLRDTRVSKFFICT